MKKLFFALLSLASLAHADIVRPVPRPLPRPLPRPVPVDERLSYVISPIAPRPGAPVTRLVVARNGVVSKSVCRAVFPNPCTNQIVTRLPLRELNVIETLIRDARFGEVVNRSLGIHCMAVGFDKKTLTADNGRVFLKESAVICPGVVKINVTGAAARLIEKLEGLYQLSLKPVVHR